MISCCIIGGDSAIKLRDYINSNAGKSLEVQDDYIFSSFSEEEDRIKSTYLRCQKLIYLIDEAVDISADLKVLFDLMGSRAFFKIQEIWIFGKDNEVNNKGLNYFERIMIDLGFSDYFIRLSDNEVSLREVYRDITGVTESSEYKVPYNRVYRSRIADDSKIGYEPELYKKNIELKGENSVDNYNRMKDASIKSETNKVIKDSPEPLPPSIDLQVNKINIEELINKDNIFLVTGNPKAGASAFASRLAISLSNRGNSVNLLDLSPNCGSARICIRKYNKAVLVDNTELLTGKNYSNNELTIYNTADLRGLELKTAYLRYILSIPNRSESKYSVIDCSLEQLSDFLEVCNSKISKVFICSQDIKDEVLLIKDVVGSCNNKGLDTIVYLNNSINFDSSFEKITASQTKKLIDRSKIVSPVNLDADVDLSELAFLGGE